MKIVSKISFFSLIIFWFIIWNISFAAKWNLPWVTIISRSEWWADESIRFRSTPRSTSSSTSKTEKTEEQKKAENMSKIRNAWMAKNFPIEWKYEWSNTMFWNNYLIYPEYFNHHKNKIVIHHTAVNYDPNWTINDVKKQIQDIYKYHTINRNFGDIWYNFLIDQMWNIYEWRAGWEWAIWMHASSNNVTSIWISLMWNFENDTPTTEQMASLVNLVTAVAKYYKIDPYWYSFTFTTNTSKEPYVTSKVNPNIMWHEDIKATACPGDNLSKFLPRIRDEVSYRMKNWIINASVPSSWIKELKEPGQIELPVVKNNIKTNSTNNNLNTTSNTKLSNQVVSSNFSERLIKLLKEDPKVLEKALEEVRDRYKWDLKKATRESMKISKKYTINDVKNLVNQDISVLLYELSTRFDSFEIECESNCIFTIDWVNYYRSWATLTFLTDKINISSKYDLYANSISVKSFTPWWIVTVSNYKRKSYAWIPWNSFKWSLTFEKWNYPLKNWKQEYWFIVINTLPFSEYMRWIVETNDTETLDKNKVMALISKNYALFYLNKDNVHPSIVKDAEYSAIDDPDFFQKYVWAWLEKTLKKRYTALDATKNEIVMYNNYLPILPYFSCSAWFTLSAEEKWWWNDTPWLKSVYDFGKCNDFIWHWVWLAWNWAERLAKQWVSYDKILKYYYNDISIQNIN